MVIFNSYVSLPEGMPYLIFVTMCYSNIATARTPIHDSREKPTCDEKPAGASDFFLFIRRCASQLVNVSISGLQPIDNIIYIYITGDVPELGYNMVC